MTTPVRVWRDLRRDALISDDERYRYALEQTWTADEREPHAGFVLWVMLNPSTADATKDDATIRRVRGFTSAAGYSHFVVINLFAYRTRSPAVLVREQRAGVDVVGPDNRSVTRESIASAARVVMAWGAHPAAGLAGANLAERVRGSNGPDRPARYALCLGVTADGSPRHPLYTPNAASFVPWTPRVRKIHPT